MRIGIIGTGLIGGSLGLALKKHGGYKIYCWNRREEVSKKAVKLKAVDGFFKTIGELTKKSDVIVIATPLSSYAKICKEIAPYLDGKKIISDVGSVKLKPSETAKAELPEKYKSFFVPAHPIAGKEKGGIENTEAGLYKGRKVIICKTANCKKGKIIAAIWKDAGATTELMASAKHDEIYAFVSHFVQFVSHSVANIFPKNIGEFSRLMNSPQDIWNDIYKYNSTNLKKINGIYIKALEKEIRSIKAGRFKDEYEHSAYILAVALDGLVPEKYKEYAGSGYKSFTSPILKAKAGANKANPEKTAKLLKKVIDALKKANFQK